MYEHVQVQVQVVLRVTFQFCLKVKFELFGSAQSTFAICN